MPPKKKREPRRPEKGSREGKNRAESPMTRAVGGNSSELYHQVTDMHIEGKNISSLVHNQFQKYDMTYDDISNFSSVYMNKLNIRRHFKFENKPDSRPIRTETQTEVEDKEVETDSQTDGMNDQIKDE